MPTAATCSDADRRLMRGLAAGSQEAARELCEEYVPRLRAYVLQRTGLGPEIADEVAEETIVAALRSAQRFRGESTVYTWLCAIARRKVVDQYRRERRQPLSLDSLTADGLALIDEKPLPDEAAQRGEMAEMVHRAIWSLPPEQREAVLGKYLEDRTVADIAADLGKTQKAVESLLSRGRATLRKRLIAWGVEGRAGSSDEGSARR